MRIANEDIISGVAQDMSVSFNLTPIWLGHICNYSIQLVFTGTPVGAFKLQASDDPGNPNGGQLPQALNVTHWSDVSGSSQSISAAGNLLYDIANCGYNFVRVVYTSTSGAGSLTSARVNLKGV